VGEGLFFIVSCRLIVLEKQTYIMCTPLCLNLKIKIISCFLISVSPCSYYCALELGNSFQREMF
jgi:hypothetical protein